MHKGGLKKEEGRKMEEEGRKMEEETKIQFGAISSVEGSDTIL